VAISEYLTGERLSASLDFQLPGLKSPSKQLQAALSAYAQAAPRVGDRQELTERLIRLAAETEQAVRGLPRDLSRSKRTAMMKRLVWFAAEAIGIRAAFIPTDRPPFAANDLAQRLLRDLAPGERGKARSSVATAKLAYGILTQGITRELTIKPDSNAAKRGALTKALEAVLAHDQQSVFALAYSDTK
jgi:hypothetical protein